MPARDLTESVRSFLVGYEEAFVARDGERIATMYYVPCVTVRGDGSIHAFLSGTEIRDFFQKVSDGYAGEGGLRSEMKNLSVVPIGGRSALASVTWGMLRLDGTPIRDWRQSYNLVWANERWTILASTFHLD